MLPTDDEFDRRVHERHMQAVRNKLINGMKLIVGVGTIVLLIQLTKGMVA